MDKYSDQKKILLLWGIVLGAILVFWLFIYYPKNKQLKDLRDELDKVQTEINKYQKISEDRGTFDIIASRYKELEQKLPMQEEPILRDLAKEAVEKEIEVLSIKPYQAIDSKLPIKVEGYQCKELTITMELVTSYKKLGEYLGVLQNQFTSIVRLDKLDVEKESEKDGESVLLVVMELTLFMLIPET